MWREVKCSSIRRTRIVDLGSIIMRACNFKVGKPKSTKFFFSQLKRNCGWLTVIPIFDFSIRFRDNLFAANSDIRNRADFLHVFCLSKFLGASRNLHPCCQVCLAARHVPKFCGPYSLIPKPIGAHSLNFKPIFTPFVKSCWGNPVLGGVCASNLWGASD